MNRRVFLKSGLMLTAFVSGLPILTACAKESLAIDDNKTVNNEDIAVKKVINNEIDDLSFKKVLKTEAEWKRILTKEQYRVARKGGTEIPYSSPLNKIKEKGIFVCVCCDLPVFASATKYDSETGWPSFYAPISKTNVIEKNDYSLEETRKEVLCARCDAHLGHVFDDGPKPTGLRYCMNGVAMKFIKET
jgi:methionine-R-sulfoxide reductase